MLNSTSTEYPQYHLVCLDAKLGLWATTKVVKVHDQSEDAQLTVAELNTWPEPEQVYQLIYISSNGVETWDIPCGTFTSQALAEDAMLTIATNSAGNRDWIGELIDLDDFVIRLILLDKLPSGTVGN